MDRIFGRKKPADAPPSVEPNEVNIFVVLQQGSQFYIHDTNSPNDTIKPNIQILYKQQQTEQLFTDIFRDKTSYEIQKTNKSYRDIVGSPSFGSDLTQPTKSRQKSLLTDSVNTIPFKNDEYNEFGGGKPSSHLKYKKRTTSQKRRKLNIKTLKLKS